MALDAVAVDDDVQGVEGVEEALGVADGEVDSFDPGVGGVLADGDSVEGAGLVGDDEAALGVWGHGDPGAFGGLGDGVEELGLEAWEQREGFGGGGGGWPA